MGTKTIGLREDAYERLKVRKRSDESFTDLVERLLDEATVDWREGFGTLETDEMKQLEEAASESRTRTGEALSERQQTATEELTSEAKDPDEAA